METLLKQLVKDALFEALAEYFGDTEEVATYDTNKGGNNVGTGANSGGTPGKDNKPKPDVGVGTWSLK